MANDHLALTVPGAYALHLVHLVERLGVPPPTLIEGTGVALAALTEPGCRLEHERYAALIRRAYALTGEDALAFYVGLEARVSTHGFLGFAAMTAATLGEAADLAVRFAATRTLALELSLEVSGARAALEVHERAPLGEVKAFVTAALLVGLARIARALTGEPLSGSLELSAPPPADPLRLSTLVGGEVRFRAGRDRLVFDAALLALPLTLADPAAARLAREQCERELSALGARARLPARVRGMLDAAGAEQPGLEEVARRLHRSPRTLKRQLAEEGTSFSRLVEDHRRARAEELLGQPDLTLEEVAERIGYADATSFARAFRRWTGRSPAATRRDR
jgi:AraC-like DNA-binding protein